MFKQSVVLLVVMLLSACRGDMSAPNGKSADLVISGGPIYTGLDEQPRVEAIAVTDGKIVATGDLEKIRSLSGKDTQFIDLQNSALYPGFVDAHAHLLSVGLREKELRLDAVKSIAQLVSIVESEIQGAEPGKLIYGDGWLETHWPEGRFPNRFDLDKVSPSNPVILVRADGHAMVANSYVLAQVGIDAGTEAPDGGLIEKDSSGVVTGILVDAAMSLVDSMLPTLSTNDKREALVLGSEFYVEMGWTGMHAMSADPASIPVLESLSESGEVSLRVYNVLDSRGLLFLKQQGSRVSKNGKVVTRAVKLYIDGALGSRGAALFEDYSDAPGEKGLLLMKQAQALSDFRDALAHNIQITTHAIGDLGNKQLLDWYQQAFSEAREKGNLGSASPRWRVEHAQVIRPEDIHRFAQLGVIPSMQPSHAIGDLHFAPDRLGDKRLAGAYAWRSLIDAGAIVAGGSDAPVEKGDPMIEFYAAIARRDLAGFQGADWHPDQAVSRQEALKMFTAWPAYAAFQEEELGTVEVGKRADFSVFSRDIMTIPAREIPAVKAVMTIIDGKVVFALGQGNM